MDMLYSVSLKHQRESRPYEDEDVNEGRISLSRHNILAFIRSEGPRRTVFVVDLDRPWEPWTVTTLLEAIDVVEWDRAGERLLICARNGDIRVMEMSQSLLNQWTNVHSSSLRGERVVTAKWFHQGSKMAFRPGEDRRPLISPFAPTLTSFGGGHHDGFVVVTSTGLVKAFVEKSGSSPPEFYEALEPILPKDRFRVGLATLAFAQDGGLVMATSDGNPDRPINCFRITLRLEAKNQMQTLGLLCKPMPSFFTRAKVLLKECSIIRLKFLDEDLNAPSPHSLLVALKGRAYPDAVESFPNRSDPNGIVTRLEFWEIVQIRNQIHRVFHSFAKMNMPPTISVWRMSQKLSLMGDLKAIATSHASKFSLSPGDLPECSPTPTIGLIFGDGTMRQVDWRQAKCLRSTTLSIPPSPKFAEGDSVKRIKLEEGTSERFRFVDAIQSHLGCFFCVIDAMGSLYVLRSLPLKEITFSHAYWLSSLFAYCLSSGMDFWEVALLVRPGLIESILENVSTFLYARSLVPPSSPLQSKVLLLKECLYRGSSSSTGQAKATDAYLKMFFTSLATMLKALLRSRQDKSPAENLALACASLTETDVKKILVDLDNKEFVVDPQAIMSLQHLLQWIGEFALLLMASLPLSQQQQHSGGHPAATTTVAVSLVRDCNVLSVLRQLLLLIYSWGIMEPSSLPVFTTTTPIPDANALLFKLVTRAWIAVKEGSPFDETLLEECSMLQNQLVVSSMDQLLPLARNSLSPSQLPTGSSASPFHYTFHQDPSTGLTVGGVPDASYSTWEKWSASHVNSSNQQRDMLHNTQMGVSPYESCKRCSRCGCQTAMVLSVGGKEKTLPIRAWEQRWFKQCFCGGLWVFHSNKVVKRLTLNARKAARS